MKVTVVVPSYNHGRYLRERIESILNQTFSELELIILDDCSTDDSQAIIQEYKSRFPQIVTRFNDSNSGSPASQWNLGSTLAKGEYLWIAESDDAAYPDFLQKTVKVLDEYPDAGLVFTDSEIINEKNGVKYLASERNKAYSNEKLDSCFNKRKKDSVGLLYFADNPIVNVSSVLFRKSFFSDVGGADSNMKYCSDWMLYVKISGIAGAKYIPEPLSVFRLHSGSSYHDHYKSNTFLKEKMKVLSLILRQGRFSPVLVLRYLRSFIKVLVLRIIFILRLETLLRIELPRRPRLVLR